MQQLSNCFNLNRLDLANVTEGEAMLADRACKRLMKMSFKEAYDTMSLKNIPLTRERFISLVESGAVSGSRFETHASSKEGSIKDKLLSTIKQLESQLNEYKESLNILESHNKYLCEIQ